MHKKKLWILEAMSIWFASQISVTAQLDTWTTAGSLLTPRTGHTATLLLDGRVLVVGGFLDFSITRTVAAVAELYDPATDIWTATGKLHTARSGHTETLLRDGRVLVVGGFLSRDVVTASVELYDPTSGSWCEPRFLFTARGSHSATLLNDGRVLVAGGRRSSQSPTATAEIFTAARVCNDAGWTFAANLNAARERLSATLLQDGRVLVISFQEIDGLTLASSELYDPVGDRWIDSESPSVTGGNHAATRLADGRVLAAGVIESGPSTAFHKAEIYDPLTDAWHTTGRRTACDFTFSGSRSIIAIVLGDGRAMAVACRSELYDPATVRWTDAGNLNSPRTGHTATLLADGRVLVAGGHNRDDQSLIASAETYDYVQLLYPQLALGGGFEVVLFVSNLNQRRWTGRGELDGGNWPLDRPWSMDGQDRTGQSGFAIELAPNQTRKFVLSSNGPAVSGWLEIKGGALTTTSLSTSFFYNFAAAEELDDSTGVPVARRVTGVRVPVELSANLNTGIAVRRAQDPITFILLAEDGTRLQVTSFNRDGTLFLDQIFVDVPEDFVGSLELRSSRPFYATALRQEIVPGPQLRFQLTSVSLTPIP